MGKLSNKIVDIAGAPADAVHPAVIESPTAGAQAPVERTDFPCSVAQERFWLLDRLDPGNSAYNVAVRWRLEGRIATDLLEHAWLQIIERHEVLRTVFLEVDGAPMQRVMQRAPFRLNEIDLSNLQPELQQPEADRIGVIEARAPFDVSSGPLIRATLLRFSPTLSIILVTTHQIVSDGWSIGVMAREMGMIYDALRQGRAVTLEPLSVQYADYSEWQLEWLKVRGTAAESAYWTAQLAGVKPFRVIADRPRPAMPTTNGAIVSRLLPRELTNRAQALSVSRGATLFATAFAALCATLSRFTNETEIVVGTQVSGRDQVELEGMIGQFVNSLILRNDLSGNPTFGEIIDDVRDTIAQALENRHIPIERLLGMVKSERSDANTPPISVNFIFQKTFIQNTVYGDFSLIDMPSLPAGAIYDLNLFMVERPDGWRFSCQYNTDQFERATAERLLSYVETLLGSAVADASQRLSELQLSSTDDARLLYAKLNDTRTLYPRELNLGQLFEAQAARGPNVVAVQSGDRTLTYAQLNGAATRLATYLIAQGVIPGSRVGVSLPSSVDLAVCLIAILRAGGTYVPVDPAASAGRRLGMLRAAGAALVIGQRLERAYAGMPVRYIDIEAALANGQQPATGTPMPSVPSDSFVCELFAGAHEGSQLIGISHRNLANLIYSLAKRPGVGERDVVVAASSIESGRAAVEMFLPLLVGARLVLPVEKELATGRTLLHLLQGVGATVMYGSPQTWGSLLDAEWIGYPALKMLCSAGDLNARLIERLSAIGGEIWSLYGEPEAGVWSATRLITAKDSPGVIGTPIANTSMYVLDSTLRLAAIGVVGQLHIAGDGLTARAAATCVAGDAGAALYPTGSLARLRNSGQLEALGRMDSRIWHRGQWIDPIEVERVLETHGAVAQAGVTRIADSDREGALTAFVVPRDPVADSSGLPDQLAAMLAEHLPASSIPPSIVVRNSLPHDAAGQLDRRALHSLPSRAPRKEMADRPEGNIEVRLAALWATMLGVPTVVAGDNFFELGGHSLLAARMLTQVEREFGRRIKLATLFLAPTLRDFAKVLSQADLRDFDFRQVVKIQPHGAKRPLIAINNTGIYYGLAKNLGPDQPVYSLQLFDPSVRDSSLPNTLEDVAKGYVDLIRLVQPHGPYNLMGWCVAGALAFEIARQLAAQGQEISHLFLIDSWLPGYYARLPTVHRWVATYSLRAQLILEDWRRVLSSQKSVRAFIKQRTLYKRLARLFGGSRVERAVTRDQQASLETYDQWLLAYLQRLTDESTQKPYDGPVTLLRSRLEPAGWFFREDAGWSKYASAGVSVKFVDGNHFTMFQEPGSSQMAAHVAAALERPSAAAPRS